MSADDAATQELTDTIGDDAAEDSKQGRVILIGFGPAGQRVAEGLLAEHGKQLVVVEFNPRNARLAEGYGLEVSIGDATHAEVLENAGIDDAVAVVITLPDPGASRHVIHLVRDMNPDAKLLVRARYHVVRWELQLAGADTVIDEEDQIGMRLADEVNAVLTEYDRENKASED